MTAKRNRKQTVKRKSAPNGVKESPRRSTLAISVHRTQAILLLLIFALIGILLAFGVWKAGSLLLSYSDRSTRYDRIIVAAGRRNGVYPPLLKAVIWKESRFDSSCRGSKGDRKSVV